jgi:crotonobetainyl-CoA:carnitine CoA-transferase CaiB-like acyl-CoA transferase
VGEKLSIGALEGVKVLDLTHYIAGPYCTKLLADFGADVTKVERRSGDPARRMGPFYRDEAHPEKSLLFLYLNTNKRSVTLNLKSASGLEILKKLVQEADLLVENFSPRVMPCLGLDYKALQEINPSLVMVSISNFGQTGPYRDYQATEIVEYALGGLMAIFGAYDREPLKHALHQAQFKAGTNAASAALIALYHQHTTGQGRHVDVSIQESMASALRDVVSNYTYAGAIRRRQPNHSGDLTRIRKVSDGYVLPNVYAGVEWKLVADFLGAPELMDEKFATPSARLANAEELGQILDQHFGTQKKFEMFYAAHKLRFTYGVVQSPDEVLDNPQYAARGYFVDVRHPAVGTVRHPGAPFLMSDTPWCVSRPAPTLGQHNYEVFGKYLGYSQSDLAQLRAAEVI